MRPAKLVRRAVRRAASALAPWSSLALPRPRREDYYADPALGLAGAMDPAARLFGVDEALLPLVRGRSVLDLGCAEGLVLRRLVGEGGATAGHGLDHSPTRIASARRVCAGEPRLRFDVVELGRSENLDRAGLAARYDVVLCLGVYQHLPPRTRAETLRRALARCGGLLAFRCPVRRDEGRALAEALEVIAAAGFRLERELRAEGRETFHLFRREGEGAEAAAGRPTPA